MLEQPDAPFPPGLTAQVELTVADTDTARAVGSGDVPVLATPRVLALAEAATVAATTPRMPPAGPRSGSGSSWRTWSPPRSGVPWWRTPGWSRPTAGGCCSR